MEIVQQWVTLIKDVLTGLAALVAIFGLRTWQKELKGKTEYDLARRLLKAVYKVREEFALLRFPFHMEDEVIQVVKDGQIEGNISENGAIRPRVLVAIYERRWQRLQNAFAELNPLVIEAEAIWDKEAIETFAPLYSCRHNMENFIHMYLDNLRGESIKSEEVMRRIQAVIYERLQPGEERNAFSEETQSAVETAEAFLKPHLMAKAPARKRGRG